MNELKELYIYASRFIYPEYTAGVIAVTEALRQYFPGYIRYLKHPKYLTLVVSLFLGAIGIYVHQELLKDAASIYKMLISFAVAKIIYDYAVKIAKDNMSAIMQIIKNKLTIKSNGSPD